MSKSTYAVKLRDPRWQRKRLEIMQRDEFACQHCGGEDVTLNVHHLHYLRNSDPWEYPNDMLVTLCKDCHEQVEEIKRNLAVMLRSPIFVNLCSNIIASVELGAVDKLYSAVQGVSNHLV